jgi:FHA domain
MATNMDVGANEWLIIDDSTHLRIWGSNIVHPLPPTISTGTIGAADDCWLQLRDPSGRVSRQHAKLTYSHEINRWEVADLQSKNGITQDGARQVKIPLTPGVELGIGGVTLIVESPMLGTLRELLMRVVGWGDQALGEVDLALRAARLAATRREALQLYADDDLSSISTARLLHARTLGSERPFVLCARRPRRTDPSAWASYDGLARYESGVEALAAAAGGTLCVWPRRQPHDFGQVLEAHRDPSSRVQLIVCARTPDPVIASKIVIRSLTDRASELERIIDAYAVDAGAAPGETLRPSDREWIRIHESKTLAKIQTATQRLVAIRLVGITRAAELLGMSHSSLSEWIARRTLDLGEDADDDEPE